jgi:hypothetical protein
MDKDELLKALDNLPSDPEAAFSEICRLLKDTNFAQTDSEFDNLVLDLLRAFGTRYGITMPTARPDEKTSDYASRLVHYGNREANRRDIGDVLNAYDDKRDTSQFGFAVLTSDEKVTINNKIAQIRDLIVSSQLGERKKEALLKRLSALEVEVNSDRTATERFFGFLTDLAFVSGEMAKGAKPAIDEFKDVLRIVLRSRAKNEGVELPGPEEWPQLPGPDEFENKGD